MRVPQKSESPAGTGLIAEQITDNARIVATADVERKQTALAFDLDFARQRRDGEDGIVIFA